MIINQFGKNLKTLLTFIPINIKKLSLFYLPLDILNCAKGKNHTNNHQLYMKLYIF